MFEIEIRYGFFGDILCKLCRVHRLINSIEAH
jgi:hypothetical protein